ncbi:hypothetical protein U1Q18_003385 [Sarracenia purpurea var. burkii]
MFWAFLGPTPFVFLSSSGALCSILLLCCKFGDQIPLWSSVFAEVVVSDQSVGLAASPSDFGAVVTLSKKKKKKLLVFSPEKETTKPVGGFGADSKVTPVVSAELNKAMKMVDPETKPGSKGESVIGDPCPATVKPLVKKGGVDLIAEVSNLTTKVSRAPVENKIVSEGPVLDPPVLKENTGIPINKNEVNVVNPANENEETISEEDADEGETDSGVCEGDEDGSEEDTDNDDEDKEVTVHASDEVNLSDSVIDPCSEMDCVDSGQLGKRMGQLGMKVKDAHLVIDKMSQPNTGKSNLCESLPNPSTPGKDRVLPLEGKLGTQTDAQKASRMPNFTSWASLLTNRSAISTRLEQVDVGASSDSGILEIEADDGPKSHRTRSKKQNPSRQPAAKTQPLSQPATIPQVEGGGSKADSDVELDTELADEVSFEKVVGDYDDEEDVDSFFGGENTVVENTSGDVAPAKIGSEDVGKNQSSTEQRSAPSPPLVLDGLPLRVSATKPLSWAYNVGGKHSVINPSDKLGDPSTLGKIAASLIKDFEEGTNGLKAESVQRDDLEASNCDLYLWCYNVSMVFSAFRGDFRFVRKTGLDFSAPCVLRFSVVEDDKCGTRAMGASGCWFASWFLVWAACFKWAEWFVCGAWAILLSKLGLTGGNRRVYWVGPFVRLLQDTSGGPKKF